MFYGIPFSQIFHYFAWLGSCRRPLIAAWLDWLFAGWLAVLLTCFELGWFRLGPWCAGKSLKNKSVIQRRLELSKAVRFERYVLDDFACWASCEGLHSLSRMLIYSEIFDNQICDSWSAGISEGRQI